MKTELLLSVLSWFPRHLATIRIGRGPIVTIYIVRNSSENVADFTNKTQITCKNELRADEIYGMLATILSGCLRYKI